jgi:hypothetical protein
VHVAFVETTHCASQRFNQGSILVLDAFRYDVGILLDNARRQPDELGVGSVVEEQVLAKVLLAMTAKVTLVTGSRVSGNNALAYTELSRVFAYRDYISGHFMAEQCGRTNHFGVIAAAEYLHIRAAGERGTDAHEKFSGTDGGDWYGLEANIFLAVENRRLHTTAFD